jgi:hypothetical protein
LLDTFENAVELLRDSSHVRNCRASEWERLFLSAGMTPEIVNRSRLRLDGPGWVARIQTPAPMVETIRTLFQEATPAVRRAFALRTGEDWGWTIPIALLRGTVPATR